MFEAELSRIPVEPPRSVSLLPGLKLRNAISRLSLVVPLIFAAFFALMPLIAISEDPNARLAFGRTETTGGRVVQVSRGDECQGESTTILYAYFPMGGPEYRSVESVCLGSPYFNVAVGDAVPVRFLVSDPSISTIVGERGGNPAPYLMFLLFPLFALFVFGPFLLPQLRRVLRDQRLFRRGRLTPATVLFVKQNFTSSWPGWPGSAVSEVFVSFQSSSGAPLEARATCQNDWLLTHLSPGSAVHIAYLPHRPARAVLLEAYLR